MSLKEGKTKETTIKIVVTQSSIERAMFGLSIRNRVSSRGVKRNIGVGNAIGNGRAQLNENSITKFVFE